MILAAKHPQCVDHLVVWGANATVTKQDVELYEKIRDTSKWSPKMKEPLEGEIIIIITIIIIIIIMMMMMMMMMILFSQSRNYDFCFLFYFL